MNLKASHFTFASV